MNTFDKHGIGLFQSRNELGNRQDVGEISVVGNVGLCKSFRARARWSRLCILVSRLRSQERKDEKKTQKAQKITFSLFCFSSHLFILILRVFGEKVKLQR